MMNGWFQQDWLTEVIANFHFLRPDWFYALIPALLLFTLLRYRQRHHSNWAQAIDAHLLPHILDNPDQTVRRNPLTLLFVAWVMAILALAGPVWQKTLQPVHEREDALVIILDLTRSMLATDVKPDRVTRAKRKLIDLLEPREEGTTALVVFAGDAHVVTPLTDDTNTIVAMIPELSPGLLPARGSQLAPALERAIELFRNGGATSGRILIMTDEIRDVVAAQRVVRQYRNAYPVSIMSVGTTEGAPIPLNPGIPAAGFLKDNRGNLVIPKVDPERLQDFATLAGGRYSPMTLTEEDIAYLLAEQPLMMDEQYRELEQDFDVWQEQGPWLLLLLLPLAALAFRRGWVWSLALLLVLPGPEALALGWDDLWFSRDEQGTRALKAGDADAAAKLFKDPAWRATASYRGENFEDAANQFGVIETSDGQYNLGNSLARQTLFDEAIEAYDKALALNPDNEDARFNKMLIEQIQKESQEQSEPGESDESEDSDSSESDSEDEGEQQAEDKNQQESEGQEAQQEEGEQQDGEQQDGEEAQQAIPSPDEAADPLKEEEQQALQQWLRRVPDNPGGLLKRKFQLQHDERLREGKITNNEPNTDW